MATRSTISVVKPDGTIEQAYCHWDGYLEGNGKILVDHYNNFKKALELVRVGSIRELAEKVTDCDLLGGPDECFTFADFNDYINNAQFEEFNYLFINDAWYYIEDKPKLCDNFRFVYDCHTFKPVPSSKSKQETITISMDEYTNLQYAAQENVELKQLLYDIQQSVNSIDIYS